MKYTVKIVLAFGLAIMASLTVCADNDQDSADVTSDTLITTGDDTTILAFEDTSFLTYNDSLFISHFRFAQNLDSLLLLWYVKTTAAASGEETTGETDSIVPEYPDSIYAQRLKMLPSYIELSYNEVVRKFIDVYVNKRRKQVGCMIGLSECYFPVFEEILDLYDLPMELKYLPVIESALNPRAVSRAGATGMWQFMYTTGKLYKLEINTYVDERLNPLLSSYAAARYLKDLYGIYNDWILALAAYNCGPGNVNKAIRRSKGKTGYWELYPYLPRETRGYVPAFIAAVYAMNYYPEHNIVPQKFELSLYDTVLVTEELHLKQVAEVLGLPLRQIRDLNPQYRKDIIPAKSQRYPLRLPFEYTTKFIDLEDSIYNYNDSLFFLASNADVPAGYKTSRYVPQPPSPDMVILYYKVKAGDNIGFIADWYGVKTSDLRYWNNISRNFIKAGQKLIIYKHKNMASKYSMIDEMTFAEKQAMIGKKTDTTQQKEKVKIDPDGEYIYYTVRKGDNFWTIAKKYPGVSNTDIMNLNNITDAGSLTPGQKLRIKKKE
ncbi:MAG: transglycosylase SLT domain-containing protein [Bacteroidetes bacterium]|nr:transglycosylase SLT domain-containing protein [Bacteroidota bacterium]